MGLLDKNLTCGRCRKDIRSDESAVPYRDGSVAHADCAPPRGTRRLWSHAKRSFMRATERAPIWTLLLELRLPHGGVNDPVFLLVEEEPFRVTVNGSNNTFIGEPYWSAALELEDLGFIAPTSEKKYELTAAGKEAAEIGPPIIGSRTGRSERT